ncbi:MAG TPA: PKD domain-containing protein [Candidatus Paceibacterota bacterium]|nr:PKD domain-containing protein [Candidatus Paceibacterota bacterium]
MRFRYKGSLILGLMILAGVFLLPKGAFALGFDTLDIHYSSTNPTTLYVTTTSQGNSFKASSQPCTNSHGDDDRWVYEYQNSTVAYWYISQSDDDGSYNVSHAVNGLSGSTRPSVNQNGDDGCGYTDAVQWTYGIHTSSVDISDLNNATYYYCLEVIADNGSPTTFTRCDSFKINKVETPGSFSLLSATGNNTTNSCSVVLDWSASSRATSYTVYVHFWSTGSWQQVQSGITSTDYTYAERKGVDLYYKIVAVNSAGSYTSNVQATSCPLPSVTITSSPSSVAYGGSSTIYWTPQNAFYCGASGGSSGWAGSRTSSNGQHAFGTGALYNPPSSYTYYIYCSDGDGGYASPTVYTTVSIAPPPVPTVTLTANPTSVAWDNSGSTLSWSSTNATSCSASGDWSGAKATSGNQATGALSQIKTYTFTLTCTGIGGSGNDSAQVTVNPPTPTLSGLTTNASSINYCTAGPSGTTVSWTYSDPASSPQAYYEVQVTNNGSFASPMYDSGKVNSSSTTASLQNASLAFNTTYQARVMVWDALGGSSAWYNTNNWTTPPNAYPQVNFTWTPTSPQASASVPFTDGTTFSDSGSGHSWSWTFGDGGTSTSQNPSHTFGTDNTYTVSLTATDNQNQSCSASHQITVQKPIPSIKEVNP